MGEGEIVETLWCFKKHGKYKNRTHSSSSSHIRGRSQRSLITKNATCRPSLRSSYSAELSRMTKAHKFEEYFCQPNMNVVLRDLPSRSGLCMTQVPKSY